MKHVFIKKALCVLLASVMVFAAFSMTAFATAEGGSGIAVEYDYDSTEDNLIVTVKSKTDGDAFAGGAIFLKYDPTKLDAPTVAKVGDATLVSAKGDTTNGFISAVWAYAPAKTLEASAAASNPWMENVTLTFPVKDNVTITNLTANPLSLCTDTAFMESCGGYTDTYIAESSSVKYYVNGTDTEKLDSITFDSLVPATGVSISTEVTAIKAGETRELTAVVAPAGATNAGITWTSSNTNVATVDSTGKITAVAEGTATITATTNDGGFTATYALTVEEADEPVNPPATEKTISAITDSTATTAAGIAPLLPEKVSVTYSDGSTANDVAVTWAEVKADDYKEKGTFNVEGTVAGTNIKAKCVVTVTDKVITSIEEAKATTKTGTAPKLPAKVKVTYSDKSTAELDVTWAAVDAKEYEKTGSFTVKGTVAGTNIEAVCKVTVEAASNGDDDGDSNSPDTGDSLVGIAVAGIAFLISMMIAVFTYKAIMKKKGLNSLALAGSRGGHTMNSERMPSGRYYANRRPVRRGAAYPTRRRRPGAPNAHYARNNQRRNRNR